MKVSSERRTRRSEREEDTARVVMTTSHVLSSVTLRRIAYENQRRHQSIEQRLKILSPYPTNHAEKTCACYGRSLQWHLL